MNVYFVELIGIIAGIMGRFSMHSAGKRGLDWKKIWGDFFTHFIFSVYCIDSLADLSRDHWFCRAGIFELSKLVFRFAPDIRRRKIKS